MKVAASRRSTKREIIPDPIYNDEMVTRFINKLMLDGKKSLAEKIFMIHLKLSGKNRERPVGTFSPGPEECHAHSGSPAPPGGGATYQVPMEVRSERRVSLAMRWIVGAARQRPERTMKERLAAELMDAANNTGASIKKKEDTHKMAEANKAFAHYRW